MSDLGRAIAVVTRAIPARAEPSELTAETPAPVVSTSPGVIGLALIATAAAAWTAVVGGLAVWRHNEFLSHRFDLGNMVQAVWSTTQGRPLEMTDAATGEQIVRLAAHVDPILVLLAPLWVIYPEPELLIFVQAAALAAGVYPVVRLALKHTGHRGVAVLLGAWYLVFPWMVWNAFNDFHPVSLAIPLLLYAIWFLDEDRLGLFTVVAALALLTGELVGLTVGALGIWYAIRSRRLRAGAAIAVGGFGWTVFCLMVVVPAFNDGESSRFYGRFESVGGSPTGLIATLVTDPVTVLAQATSGSDISYVIALLVPTAFLALAAPLLLIAILPQLSVNVLSDWWSTTQPTFHYSSALLPGLIAATVVGISRVPMRFRFVVAGALLGIALVSLASYPPRPGAQDFVFASLEPPARRAAMRSALELIPEGASVTATNRLGAHLSERRVVHLFPMRDGADWAALDTLNPWLQIVGENVHPRRFQVELGRFHQDSSWRLIFDQEGVRVYERLP